ncbi:MAG: hypothetical protein AABX88_03195 [Nanoarchaeota archaeon]
MVEKKWEDYVRDAMKKMKGLKSGDLLEINDIPKKIIGPTSRAIERICSCTCSQEPLYEVDWECKKENCTIYIKKLEEYPKEGTSKND